MILLFVPVLIAGALAFSTSMFCSCDRPSPNVSQPPAAPVSLACVFRIRGLRRYFKLYDIVPCSVCLRYFPGLLMPASAAVLSCAACLQLLEDYGTDAHRLLEADPKLS